MQVSKYWSKETRAAIDKAGHAYALTAWGGSARSEAEARENALAKLERWIARLGRGESIGDYEYLNRDIREELVEEIHDPQGNLIGAVTRNRYGALVLNAADVFIADIDVAPAGLIERLLAKFGRPLKDKSFHVERLKTFAAQNPSVHALIYETHSGLRVFLTDQPRDPGDPHSRQLLESLGSDHLYRTLCATQKCYRARLTPKPWRCGAGRPPNKFPREEFQAQRLFNEWLSAYEKNAQGYGVCRLIATAGSGALAPSAQRLLALHDEMAVADPARPLA